MKDEYIDKKTLCQRLSLSRSTIDRLVARGELEKTPVGRKPVYSTAGVSALMERLRTKAATKSGRTN
jgi:excisionase family DNA binding protein